MNKFGIVKLKLLSKLAESYTNDNKDEIKKILTKIKTNNDFKEMHLFYEGIENKYFPDTETAKLFVEEISSIMKDKSNKISKFCKELEPIVGNVEINEDYSYYKNLYTDLDNLMESDTLLNLDKKIISKKNLVEFLTTKKPTEESNSEIFSENENLLNAVLVNNFNTLYGNSLNEEEQSELKRIIGLSYDEVKLKTTELKECVLTKVETILSENVDVTVKQKLQLVEDEVRLMKPTKFNLYKLEQLKNGL